MDNIQKSIIAVLGFAGFVALVLPESVPFSSSHDEAVDNTTSNESVPAPGSEDVPPPAPNAEQVEGGEADLVESDDEPDEFDSFGNPMDDAEPLGSSGDDYGDSQSNASISNIPSQNVPTQAIISGPDAGSEGIPVDTGR